MTAARWLRVLGMTTLLVLLYAVVPVDTNPAGGLVLRTVLAVVVFAALGAAVIGQLRLVVSDPERHLDGLIFAIALVWILFSLAFYVISRHQPDQVDGLHTRVDALYFTASTILTIGYGDVHAVGQTARILVLLQMGFDVVFVTAAAQVVSGRVRRRAAARAGLTEQLDDDPGAPSGR
jgi:voltage-gated potassium channel